MQQECSARQGEKPEKESWHGNEFNRANGEPHTTGLIVMMWIFGTQHASVYVEVITDDHGCEALISNGSASAGAIVTY